MQEGFGRHKYFSKQNIFWTLSETKFLGNKVCCTKTDPRQKRKTCYSTTQNQIFYSFPLAELDKALLVYTRMVRTLV